MNLHEISQFLFNNTHKNLEESVYQYSKIQVRKTHYIWLFVCILTCTVLSAIIVGQSEYEAQFEFKQLAYKKAVDDHFKALENRISILKKVVRMEQYHNEMGIK